MLRMIAFMSLVAGVAWGGPAAKPPQAESLPSAETPAAAARQFIELLRKGDVEKAVKMTEGMTVPLIKPLAEELAKRRMSIAVADSREDGDVALVILTIASHGQISVDYAPLLKIKERWVLTGDPEPRLDDAGKKRYESLKTWADRRCEELRPTTRPG